MSDCRLQIFTNNAVSLLQEDISASALLIKVQPGLGALFPQPINPGEWFVVTLETVAAPLQREIVKIIGRSGDDLIVDPAGRGWEGTTAQSWTAGEVLVDHRVTAGTLRCLQHTTNFGEPTTNVEIIVGASETTNVLDVTGPNKTCKWIVTIKTADDRICMVEILAVYKQPSPIFNQYAKVGDKISFGVNVVATPTDMVLEITNNDTSNFTSVDVMRLQHYQ